MNLTGKAREHFVEWYPDWVRNLRNDYHKFTNDTLIRKFDREVSFMKWGVYQEFFKDGIAFGKEDFEMYWVYSMANGDNEYYQTPEETIDRVLELYNN